MDALGILEKKIKTLLEFIDKLKDENSVLKDETKKLAEEKNRLSLELEGLNSNLETVEGAVAQSSKNLEELSQEKALTKMVVEDLIKSIDSLVEQEDMQ